MKIFTIATSFPYPPDDGTKIQVYERLRSLSRRHDLTLLCVSSESISTARMNEMERYCRCVCMDAATPIEPVTAIGKAYQMLRSVSLGEPYYIHDQISQKAHRWLRQELHSRHYDIVDADVYAHAYLCPDTPALRVAIFHSIADTCARQIGIAKGFVQKNTKRLYSALTRRYEARVIRAADLCVTLTEDNRRDLQRLYPSARVRNCLSNGIDMDYFAYQRPTEPPAGVCFVGKMDYAPNIDAVLWFARAVFPSIREELPQFRFVIIGSNPADAVKALAVDPGITVTGYVNDIRPHVRQCGLMALPMRMGGGILNKLLQSLAMGVPVVATSLSLEGLAVIADRDLMVADTAVGMASCIVRLANDKALRERLAVAGRQYLEAAHQWSSMVMRYETELRCCLADRQRLTVAPAEMAHP